MKRRAIVIILNTKNALRTVTILTLERSMKSYQNESYLRTASNVFSPSFQLAYARERILDYAKITYVLVFHSQAGSVIIRGLQNSLFTRIV